MKTWLVIIMLFSSVSCSPIAGTRDKSFTLNRLNMEDGIFSIAVLPVRETAVIAGLSSRIEAELSKTLTTRQLFATIVDTQSFNSRLAANDLAINYSQWLMTYEATGILDARPLGQISKAVGARFFVLVRSISLDREKILPSDTGYTGYSYGNVWRTNLKILSEVIDTEKGNIVWKGVGFAEDLTTRKTIATPIIIYNAINPEIEEFIDDMVRVAVNGLISQIGEENREGQDRPRAGQVVESVSHEGSRDDLSHKPLKTSSSQTTYTQKPGEKKVSEYWCWGLGVLVKTEQNTVITKIDDVGYSSARTHLRIGDEIVRIGKENISLENAYNVLTNPMPKEADGLVPILVRRDGQDLAIRFKPNNF